MTDLSAKQIEEIAKYLKLEQGEDFEDSKALLKRTLTVGMLKKALAGIDDSLPVELEVVLDINEEGDCTTQPGFAIHSYQIQEGSLGSDKFVLVGALPGNSEAYAEAFELDAKAPQ